MRRNYTMRKLERRHRKPSELLLVPMIDIFTVLVTFLLMTAVFSRTVILELKLPGPDAPSADVPPQGLVLEVVVRGNGLVVQDRNSGPLKNLPRTAGASYDLAGLQEYLQVVKARYPQMTEATMLLENDIPYDDLVQVMDALRILEQRQDGQLVQASLFPDVSLGDAAPEAP